MEPEMPTDEIDTEAFIKDLVNVLRNRFDEFKREMEQLRSDMSDLRHDMHALQGKIDRTLKTNEYSKILEQLKK